MININGNTRNNHRKHWDTRGRTGTINKGGYRVFSVGSREVATRTYEHRKVVEELLGVKLSFKDHVHHLNGNKTDNRPENLKVISSSDHLREHALARGLGKLIRPTRIGNQHGGQFSDREIERICAMAKEGAGPYLIAKTLRHSPTSIYKYLL